MTACVSAVDDTTAFGFSDDLKPSVASVADAAGEANTSADQADQADRADGSENGADGTVLAASSGAASKQTSDPAPSRRSQADSLNAYNDRQAQDGEGVSPGGKQKSLFTSLFARSQAMTPIPNAERGKRRRVVLQHDGPPGDGAALPGVDPNSLFEIGQKASANEDALEDFQDSYQVASLSGLARLAPNGLKVQNESVETSCFPPRLVGLLRAVEQRYGEKVIVTSGYRSPSHNRAVNGARASQHMECKAADIIIPNQDRFEVASFVRSLPGRGGVGTYCYTQSIHIDVGPKRDWNWRCRQRQ